jgi:hypothetical protein
VAAAAAAAAAAGGGLERKRGGLGNQKRGLMEIMSGLPEHVRMQMVVWSKLLVENEVEREQVINALKHRMAMNRFKPSALAELEQFMKELKIPEEEVKSGEPPPSFSSSLHFPPHDNGSAPTSHGNGSNSVGRGRGRGGRGGSGGLPPTTVTNEVRGTEGVLDPHKVDMQWPSKGIHIIYKYVYIYIYIHTHIYIYVYI